MLNWMLGLTVTSTAGGWAALQWQERAKRQARAVTLTEKAAWYCLAGDPSANSQVEQALRDSPTYAPARLLRACLELEAGRWDEARRSLEAPPLKNTTEAKLLLELAGRRPEAPDWRHAFFDSWKAVGRPDFAKSDLLPAPLEPHVVVDDVERVWARADDAQRLMLAVLYPLAGAPAGRTGWFAQQLEASTSVPLLLGLFAQLIHPDTHPNLTNFVLPTLQERLRQLAGPSPQSLQLALFSFLDERPPTALLQRGDLEALEQLLTIPEWKQSSNEQLFLEMRARLDGLLTAPGHHAWSLVTTAQAASLGDLLLRRVQASREHLDDDDQRLLGRLLWELGARIRKQRSHVEMDLGMRLQMPGSELTRFVPDKEEIVDRWVELGIWEKAQKQSAYSRWPLASLQEESYPARARGEDTWMQAFAGVGELP